MTLTLGTGPFGQQSSGAFNFDTGVLQEHTLYLEGCLWRVRAVYGGETVADSRRVKRLHETGHLPVYYFPMEDVRRDLLEATDHTTHCPFKGDATYWSVKVGDRLAENAVWGYAEPWDSSPLPADHVAFYHGAMDAFFEEDEEVFAHPRDPYHRVDVKQGSRRVRVRINGEVAAETMRPKLLAETGLPVRYYIPPEDVRTELLVESETRGECPYKGAASYWSAEFGGQRVEDVAWSYPDPLPEAWKARDHICFLGDGVETEVNDDK